MFRLVRNLLVVILLAALVAAGIFVCTARDPLYSLHELVAYPSYHEYDDLIRQAGQKYGVDPMLIKAVIWRESAFSPGKVGRDGERGLMQVMDAAASDWARQTKHTTFVPTDLFSPQVNIEAGTWYLKKGLVRYASKSTTPAKAASINGWAIPTRVRA
jgi:soluble lytic murein transglycosylase